MSVNLKKYLQDTLPPEELDLLVRSYDVIGDIAVIIIAPELEHREQLIGEAILANNKNINVVMKRDGVYSGEFRTIPLKVIGGETRTETVHKEYGVLLVVNPGITYFSVRSGAERKRIADLVAPGENVLVLFSGIGPYPLVISANSAASEIVGIEKNEQAHRYGLENIIRNKQCKNVKLYHGDVVDVLPKFGRMFNRIIMPLPKGAEEFLALALSALLPEGVLHFYDMQHADGFSESIKKVSFACKAQHRHLHSAAVVKCGHCAPRTYRICVDALID